MGQAEKKPLPKIVKKTSKRDSLKPVDEIDSRQTPELIVAICGAVGAGTSTVAKEIEKRFKGFSYTVDTMKISELILREKPMLVNGDRFDRIKYLQITGNELREQYGNDYLAQLAIAEIVKKRGDSNEDELVQGGGQQFPGRAQTE